MISGQVRKVHLHQSKPWIVRGCDKNDHLNSPARYLRSWSRLVMLWWMTPVGYFRSMLVFLESNKMLEIIIWLYICT